jgi:hypothetical protein
MRGNARTAAGRVSWATEEEKLNALVEGLIGDDR